MLTEAFYWDLNDETRACVEAIRRADERAACPPWSRPASTPRVLHYLKAVAGAEGDDDGKAVVAKMKELPTDDPLFGKGTIRADGRKIHPMYLFEVKKPSESKGPWDYYKLRQGDPRGGGLPAARSGRLPAGHRREVRRSRPGR